MSPSWYGRRAPPSFASSLFRDLVENRHTEVEAVLADLTRRAAALGVTTPLLDLATMVLRVHEAKLASGTS